MTGLTLQLPNGDWWIWDHGAGGWTPYRPRVHDRYCETCESTHDGTETPARLAWTCDGCGERQEYRA